MRMLIGLKKLDDKAADMLPVRLIVSIAIIAAIAGLTGYGLYNVSINSSENQVDMECKELISSLSSLVNKGEARNLNDVYDDLGSTRVKEFDLPDNLLYLSFGVDPDSDNDGQLNTGLVEKGNVIFYRVEGGSKKSIWLDKDFRFREGRLYFGRWWFINPFYYDQGYIIQDGGKTKITFELVSRNDENLILIHANDQMNGRFKYPITPPVI